MFRASLNLKVAVDAVNKASKYLIRDFNELSYLQSSKKGSRAFAQKTYEKTKQRIISYLVEKRPSFGYITPEEEVKGVDNLRWIITPISNLDNFDHNFHIFAIAVAIENIKEKKIVGSVIELPILNEAYITEQGQGAWVEVFSVAAEGKQRLRVSSRGELKKAMISCNYPVKLNHRMLMDPLVDFAYLAAGRFDGGVYKELDIFKWAAAILLAKEAGAIISDFKGNDINHYSNEVLVSNSLINNALLKTV
jgi:myo-inositol-1(or 4)-monophosphatase